MVGVALGIFGMGLAVLLSDALHGTSDAAPAAPDEVDGTRVYGWPPGVSTDQEPTYIETLPGLRIELQLFSYAHPPGRPGEVWTFPTSTHPEGWIAVH